VYNTSASSFRITIDPLGMRHSPACPCSQLPAYHVVTLTPVFLLLTHLTLHI